MPTHFSSWKDCRQKHGCFHHSVCSSTPASNRRSRAAASHVRSSEVSSSATPLTFLCCEKNQCVHSPSDRDGSQSILTTYSTKTFISTIPLFLPFISVLLPGKTPIISFSLCLSLISIHPDSPTSLLSLAAWKMR